MYMYDVNNICPFIPVMLIYGVKWSEAVRL